MKHPKTWKFVRTLSQTFFGRKFGQRALDPAFASEYSPNLPLVECPGCGRVWTLSPRSGVLRFKSHDKRKTDTPNTGRRWARGEGETDWNVVGGE
jgi:hypothetical protein